MCRKEQPEENSIENLRTLELVHLQPAASQKRFGLEKPL